MSDTTKDPGSEPEEGEAPEDELKRKFREALERKNQAAEARGGAGASGDSKIHGTHGAAGGKRSFRRKSGG